MASFNDKMKINSAIDSRVKLDLGCQHVTTADWMQFGVAYNKELVPTEKIDVRMETFFRMMPLVRPTFGRANVNNRAFFVPYRTVFPGWNDFITDASHVPYNNTQAISQAQGLIAKVPTFTNDTFLQAVTMTVLQQSGQFFYRAATTAESNAGTYDFSLAYSATNPPSWAPQVGNFVWTATGRQMMKIMNSLGYNFSFDMSNTQEYSALPLLAVARIYVDWYFPSHYLNSSLYADVMAILKYDGQTSQVLNANQLNALLGLINFVNYDSDYFVSAWENPTGPNNSNASIITINSIDNGGANGTVNAVGVSTYPGVAKADNSPTIMRNGGQGGLPGSNVSPVGNISQFVIDSLKKLTDYMKRHQLVGARALDRYLSRFGVELKHENEDRSYYLGGQKVPVQIGDVTSQSDTFNSGNAGDGEVNEGAGLGDFAGKGIGYGDGHWTYETNEYGQFVIISTIIPATGYFQGVDRNILHIQKLDFYTPEFDSLGSQAVSAAELYLPTNGNQFIAAGYTDAQQFQQIWGYSPRYAEYKVGHDRLTGDFRYGSKNVGEESWHMFRDIDAFMSNGAWIGPQDFKVGLSFIRSLDRSQYDRIFQGAVQEDGISVVNITQDMFKMIYNFEVASWSPMKSLYDNYEFEDKGKKVTEDVNGVKLN